MKVNFTSQSFRGYKNIISGCLDDEYNRTSALSIQLNNVEQNDLKDYLEMKKKQNLAYIKGKDEVINLTFIESANNEKQLLINERPWLSGEELLILKQQVDDDLYKKIESVILKGYTLVASLTERIWKDNDIKKDSFKIKTESSFKNNILELSESKETAENVINDLLSDVTPPQKIAKRINKYIKETMTAFFR